jgi:phenylacetate-CoA ligase
LGRLIKNNVGVSVIVHVRDPGALERSAGKARRVLDLRPKN